MKAIKKYQDELEGYLDNVEFIFAEALKQYDDENKRLREALAGIMLLADDMTRNGNERMALIAARCREELYAHGEIMP